MGYCYGPTVIFSLLVILNLGICEGKRGCANFGHSCYGGMGKRTPKELLPFLDLPQEGAEILIGSRFTGNKPYFKLKLNALQYHQLSRILKQWFHTDIIPERYLVNKNHI